MRWTIMQTDTGAGRPLPAGPGIDRELRLAFPGTPLSVRRALETVMDGLADLSLGTVEAGGVELVLAEALNNVVEHAYAGSDPGPVQLCCRHEEDGLHVEIRDRGREMPDGHIPMADTAPHLPDEAEIAEGGFGWFIIRHLARDIAYRREADMNVLTFRVAVGLRMLRN